MNSLHVDVFDDRTIDRCISELDKMSLHIESATDRMVRYLTDYGVQFIESNAPGIVVHVEQMDDASYRIVAEGDYAIMLEFGAGVSSILNQKDQATYAGRYVRGPRKIRGLDEINSLGKGGYVPGSGRYQFPQMEQEDDEDAIDAMEAHMQMVMYNAAQAIREEIPHAMKMFFGQ